MSLPFPFGSLLASLLVIALPPAIQAYECPKYEDIRQPSVSPRKFSISEIAEKTYKYTDTCFQDLSSKKTWNNQTVTLGGDLSTDPDSPGVLKEGFVIAGHGILEKPNYLFNVVRGASGELEQLHFYACLGKLLPFTKSVFSYLLYTKSRHLTNVELDALVAPDKASGVFDLDGLVHTNSSTWKQCSVL